MAGLVRHVTLKFVTYITRAIRLRNVPFPVGRWQDNPYRATLQLKRVQTGKKRRFPLSLTRFKFFHERGQRLNAFAWARVINGSSDASNATMSLQSNETL